MANMELLDEIVKLIETNPHKWNQESWGNLTDLSDVIKKYGTITNIREAVGEKPAEEICGTAFCVAGHAVILATGVKPKISDMLYGWNYVEWNGRMRSIEGLAKEILDLDSDQASALFGGENSLETIKAFVEALRKDPDISWREMDRIRHEIQPEIDDEYDEDYWDEDEDEAA